MIQDEICEAIREKRIIRISYTKAGIVEERTVEPHMVAYNKANHLALSAWFISGASESQSGPGWREYLLSEISSVTLFNERFLAPRPGYQKDGGKKFHGVQCAL